MQLEEDIIHRIDLLHEKFDDWYVSFVDHMVCDGNVDDLTQLNQAFDMFCKYTVEIVKLREELINDYWIMSHDHLSEQSIDDEFGDLRL
jgi:hypothetical protein